ncbi:MAG: hypothetical protein HY815_17530 [Candidatus Riflebacteria bacterium]|nr:hypothetical protein [Candidatus Riflebacteria bacterium]
MRSFLTGGVQPHVVHEELRAQTLLSIRWRFLFGCWLVTAIAVGLRPVFLAMNIELPWSVTVLVKGAQIASNWWFLAVPLALWLSWAAEAYWLRSLSLRGLAHVRSGLLAVWLLVLYTLWLPMMKLICNVG